VRKITTVGLDLAKQVFHVIGCDEHGREVFKIESAPGPGNTVFRQPAGLPDRTGGVRWGALLGTRAADIGPRSALNPGPAGQSLSARQQEKRGHVP